MIILLVTWFYYNQPPQSTHTAFKTEQACEVARQQILNDASRLEANRQAEIQQDAQRGVISNPIAPTVSVVCVHQ